MGVHLAANLRLGEDQGGRFIFRGKEVLASNQEQLVGFVDNVLVAKRVLAGNEIGNLVSISNSAKENEDVPVAAGLVSDKFRKQP